MKTSRKEITGLIIGMIVGAAFFLWVWFLYGRGTSGFDASEICGVPAIGLAFFSGIFGAIIGVAVAGRK
jgi:hypothetical protein